MLTLNKFTPFSSILIVNFEQVDACWGDDNNNDENSHDEDSDRTDFKINLF